MGRFFRNHRCRSKGHSGCLSKEEKKMKRYILSIFLILFAFQFSGFAQTAPPNIIFILTDDQRWDALGYAGNEVIHTPEMDELAREGVYFKNAFVTTPIC